jgi:hypothetical protein
MRLCEDGKWFELEFGIVEDIEICFRAFLKRVTNPIVRGNMNKVPKSLNPRNLAIPVFDLPF